MYICYKFILSIAEKILLNKLFCNTFVVIHAFLTSQTRRFGNYSGDFPERTDRIY